MTDDEMKAALATAPELLECANCWEPQVRLIGNVRADSIALVCRALLAAHAEVERMRPVYEAARSWRLVDLADYVDHYSHRQAEKAAVRQLVHAIDAARVERGGA